MAEKYSFFNSVLDDTGHYDREYLAEDYAAYFASFIGNGVYANPATTLRVSASGAMDVTVAAGKAWINGYFYENTSPKTFTLDLADGSTERIDRIVLRLDLINRKISTEVKKGVFGTIAVAPELTRTGSIYELGLGDIKINKNMIEITPTQITDTRFNTQLCGIVAGVVDQINTDGLFSKFEYEFDVWFATIKGQLSGDVATNLQKQIGSLPLLTTEDKVDLTGAINEVNGKINGIGDVVDGKVKVVEDKIAELDTEMKSVYQVFLGDSQWTAQPPYTQSALCGPIKSTDQPIIALRLSQTRPDLVKAENKAWSCIDKAETQDGQILFTCYNKKPEVSITLNVKGSY